MTAVAAGSVADALGGAVPALEAAGVESPRLDAELLLVAATGGDRAGLLADPARPIAAPEARRFGGMVRRRVAREPVAYILGRKGFRHLELAVDGRALIPRPETELLVDVAVELAPGSVLDVGTGSGAVALAVAHELDEAAVMGTDVSAGAIGLARANAERLGLTGAVELDVVAREARMATPARRGGPGWDLLLANLPYVAEREWAGLEPEITRWEPREALVAGPTGLEAIDSLLGELATARDRPRAVALEVGAGQAGAVAELVRRAGYERVETRRDLAGIERVVVGT